MVAVHQVTVLQMEDDVEVSDATMDSWHMSREVDAESIVRLYHEAGRPVTSDPT